VAEKVGPAVVFIRTERTVDPKTEGDTPLISSANSSRTRTIRTISSATGACRRRILFVFDDDNRILTNYHVIKDADKITVVHEETEKRRSTTPAWSGFRSSLRHRDHPGRQEGRAPKVTLGIRTRCASGVGSMAIGTLGPVAGHRTVAS